MLIRISKAQKRVRTVREAEQPVEKTFLYLAVEFVVGDVCPLRQIRIEWPSTKEVIRDAITTEKERLIAEFNAGQIQQQEDEATRDDIRNLLDGVLEFDI